MIKFKKFELENGLRVIVHQDKSTPIVAVNVLYNVGAKDEDPKQTGFAHLFEHLMFGGSKNIPVYDEPLQRVGGENNAFTNNDITNYYITLPKQNIETAFWLESDRMLSLAFSKKSLDVQRSVVCEEFKQNYLNKPYGDIWHILRKMVYKNHPYSWPTIGLELSHIQNATMADVKAFFKKFYCPNNAILVVAGDVTLQQVKELSEKWFGNIPEGPWQERNFHQPEKQKQANFKTVTANVPQDAFYLAFPCPGRKSPHFYSIDLLSDILSLGNSSRLYKKLIKEKQIFTELSAYITGELEHQMFIVSGKLNDGVKPDKAKEEVMNILKSMGKNLVEESELVKVKNKVESRIAYSEMNVLNNAMNLAVAELLGDADLVNYEVDKYREVSAQDIKDMAKTIFNPANSNLLYYLKK